MNTAFSERVLLYGEKSALPERHSLQAGPLTLTYVDGDLRHVILGQKEIIRRWYSALRDRNWGTIAARLDNLKIARGEESFAVSYDATHQEGDIDFFWRAQIRGEAHGRITFSMEGQARSTFFKSRLGFCLLHPMDCAGDLCEVTHPDGTITRAPFPKNIAPGAPFLEIARLAHKLKPGLWAILEFRGDIFEMEDQRNWGDASFKTFCTPLRLGYPVEVEKGTRISQSITLTLDGKKPPRKPRRALAQLTIEDPIEAGTPAVGLGWPSHDRPWRQMERQRLARLNLAHLRVDLPLEESSASAHRIFRRAASEAQRLGIALEPALFLGDQPEEALRKVALLGDQIKAPIRHWLIFHQQKFSTPPETLELARKFLARGKRRVRVGGGTNANFVHFNRVRPPKGLVDIAVFALNPQVHAFDNLTLVENLMTEAILVRSARAFLGSTPLAISPVTLRPRFNPDATGPPEKPDPTQLPFEVDPRQMSLFGAAWTLGSLKYFFESGVESLTYFETTGWRGVMDRAESSPLPDQFFSIPGGVFPLYHVLADLGEFRGGRILKTISSEPLKFVGLAMKKAGRGALFLASLSDEAQSIILPGLGGLVRLRRLNSGNAELAMSNPESFRGQSEETAQFGKAGEFELRPYEYVRMEWRDRGSKSPRAIKWS